MIVPAKTLTEVARCDRRRRGAGRRSTRRPNENQVLFACGKTEIVSRVIEGQFPDYQKIIPPRAKTTRAVLNTERFPARHPRRLGLRPRQLDDREAWSAAPPEELVPGWLGSSLVKSTSAEMGDNAGNIDASVEGGDAADRLQRPLPARRPRSHRRGGGRPGDHGPVQPQRHQARRRARTATST